MDWDQMRDQWQSRPGPKSGPEMERPGELGRLWVRIKQRDLLETVMGALLAIFFSAAAVALWMGEMPVPALFALWLVVTCVFIPLRLGRARARFPARGSNLALRDFLVKERQALLHQRHLLSTVRWWYVAPIAFGALGLFAGIRGLHWHSLAYAAVVLLIAFVIERLNQMAVRESIDPAIRTLEQQIQQLEDDLDENHQ